MNLAMLAKWCWRFGIDKNKLWYKIITDKHGSDFSCWVPVFFPSLHKIVRNKNKKLADVVSQDGSWNLNFRRLLSHTETNDLAALFMVIGDSPPVLDSATDTRRWTLNSSRIFTVKSLYSKLVEGSGIEKFPYYFIWKATIPPKVKFLVWCVIHDKLSTIDKLQVKGVNLYNSCILCGNTIETHEHLFLYCKIIHKIWCTVFPGGNWAWVFPFSMRQLAEMWDQQSYFSLSGKFIWGVILAAVIWVVWLERNCRTFEKNYNFKMDDELLNLLFLAGLLLLDIEFI
ncbi:uncharacterized protein LOC113305727 [Papaver somniferum]|uniref:uncharacterized protein LOC113305727 n=1 Tax=Papaver somniferum TaxID=3469 RepID=UPI000E6FEE2F|nr:uncharacterized protein LOC113305727 [Papaver somniferum]